MSSLERAVCWLTLLWRLLLFCWLLGSPAPAAATLTRLSQALRALHAATLGPGDLLAETPLAFLPGDGDRLRQAYTASHGVRGQNLVVLLGGSARGVHVDGPKEYLTPPAVRSP